MPINCPETRTQCHAQCKDRCALRAQAEPYELTGQDGHAGLAEREAEEWKRNNQKWKDEGL